MYNYSNNGFWGEIPPVTKNILIINLIIWGFCNLFNFEDILALHDLRYGNFYLYQLITYQFTHKAFFHLFVNMFGLYTFGRILENYWGSKRFFTYYLITGIGAGLIQLAICYFKNVYSITIGASGSIFGILLAFGMIFPNIQFFPFPVKAKYFVIGYGLLELFMGFANIAGDNIAHFAHLGGMLFGIILILYWRKKNGNFRTRNTWYQSFVKKIAFFFKRKSNTTAHKRRETDWEYNARKADESKEIDRILDKIKHSGYNSLSEKEKKKLFSAGKK
jgi:membrane associated rhomboid family serine protease